jgi:hypothetical protein
MLASAKTKGDQANKKANKFVGCQRGAANAAETSDYTKHLILIRFR